MAGSLFRSELMSRCQLYLPPEAAFNCIAELGELGKHCKYSAVEIYFNYFIPQNFNENFSFPFIYRKVAFRTKNFFFLDKWNT